MGQLQLHRACIDLHGHISALGLQALTQFDAGLGQHPIVFRAEEQRELCIGAIARTSRFHAARIKRNSRFDRLASCYY